MKRMFWVSAFALTTLAACANRTPTAEAGARQFSTGVGTSDSLSVVRFVQSLYDWYVPVAVADTLHHPAEWSLLKNRSADLDDGLRDALRADSMFGENYGNANNTRENLNFDPILDSQDPCARYQVVEARRESSEYHVTVQAICADTTWQHYYRPVVVVSRKDGRWKINNVIYDKTNLRSLLCEYAKADLRPENRERGCSPL